MTEEADTVVDTSSEPTTPVEETTTREPIVENNTEPQATERTEPKEFAIPDEYKEKGWANKIKSQEDVWKQIDNLSSLVGKKEIMKQPDWENEQSRKEFIEAMRPDSKDDYVISDKAIPEAEANLYKELMYEQGITQTQANAIFEKISEMRESQFNADDMTAKLKDMWGGEVETNTKTAMTSIRKYGSEKFQGMIDNMPNEFVAEFYDYVHKYAEAHGIKETDLAHDNSKGEPAQVDDDATFKQNIKNIGIERAKGSPDWAKIEAWSKENNEIYARKAARS